MVVFIQSKTCARKIIQYANDFYTMESFYNNRKMYEFGSIPYYFAREIINGNNIEHLVKEYMNCVDKYNHLYKYNEYTIKILFIHILAILSQTNINTDDICKDLSILYLISDAYHLIEKDSDKEDYISISNVCDNLSKRYTIDVQKFVVRVYIDVYKITYNNIDSFKEYLGNYYNIAFEYINNDIQQYKEHLEHKVVQSIESQLKKLYKYSFTSPDNVEQILLQDNLTPNEVYIYTSFMIHSRNLIVSDDNYYTILLTNVYDDIINYTVFKSLAKNTTWDHWTLCKTVADEISVCCYQQHINVINTAKFIAELHSRKVDQYIIDKFNIDTKYIIVDSKTISNFEDLDTCINHLQVLFKPRDKYLYSQYTVNNKKIVSTIFIGNNKTINNITITE